MSNNIITYSAIAASLLGAASIFLGSYYNIDLLSVGGVVAAAAGVATLLIKVLAEQFAKHKLEKIDYTFLAVALFGSIAAITGGIGHLHGDGGDISTALMGVGVAATLLGLAVPFIRSKDQDRPKEERRVEEGPEHFCGRVRKDEPEAASAPRRALPALPPALPAAELRELRGWDAMDELNARLAEKGRAETTVAGAAPAAAEPAPAPAPAPVSLAQQPQVLLGDLHSARNRLKKVHSS